LGDGPILRRCHGLHDAPHSEYELLSCDDSGPFIRYWWADIRSLLSDGATAANQGYLGRALRGGPRSINPPTANGLYYYQIPCTSVRGKTGIIGVLYVGRGGLLFAPRKRSWKPGTTLEISPLDAVSIALVPPLPQNVIQRLLIPRPLEQIEIRWNGASARFLMPRPADTCSKIVRSLETLRRIPK
jgi:hypothetical protein